ncbi:MULTISPECIES: site-specific DNA-methyltransferase [Klebsiella]|uniref:site-specific DNA-methyltransferase (adenine-specific) n=12 Tax=Klebsiella pneumoniae complex TaxID=3390273 RepID=A0A483H1W3_KLEPN|nr:MULTISPECIES: site-specific DNA-methyltransferase [Klebsiella]ELN4635715.1 site-specific DNA-methyltransferase [Escherichia coli]HDT0651500.1 site-specific DNA-methyltransferase [Klebsiella pneumoniae subsp. ozaenae]AVG04746.1 site-specific DNA-methyltransferase [Klebsiella pneumoniae]AXZ51167.1 site-specific DNA-methyltransferase [Klebsiella pneumoniae]EIV5337802.1 site-specific DNA-methyltransferase [Klebsiella pneumoniae]
MNKISPEMPELQSMNITADNITKLKSLFPEAFSEGSIDFDVLKQLLGANVDEKEERYGLNWHGKRQARQLALTPSRGTLRPCKDESVDWHNTKNLMIEGDNLEVLKLLQKSYAGKVKLIYIDPPYNTGQDFIYSDDYRDNLSKYLNFTGQVINGNKISTNTETSGRFHTSWLNMMYPRLKLAKNLLHSDGFIFVSIDSHEVSNLKIIMDDIFGEECYRNTIAVRRGIKNVQAQFEDVSALSQGHEYILLYSKNSLSRLPKLSQSHLEQKPGKWDTFWRGTDRPTMRYELFGITPEKGQWRWEKNRTAEAIENYRFFLEKKSQQMSLDDWFFDNLTSTNKKLNFVRKNDEDVVQYYVPPSDGKILSDNWMDISLSGNETIFDTEKNTDLLERIINWICRSSNDIVLDFFAGSGTTGHAVLKSNSKNNSNIHYMLIQLPEPSNKSEFMTISELTKYRLIESGKKVKDGNPDWNGDVGFRVFKLDTSNIRPWEATAETLSEQIDAYVSPILEGRSEEDLLTELMLKRGIDLSVNIETRQFDGLTVSCVDGGKLFTCFANQIPASSVEELTKGIIDWHKSLKAGKDTVCYFLDDAFENNVAKTNLCAIMEQHGLTNLHSL